MRTIEQVKEDLRSLGYGEMANALVPDDQFITATIWQIEDIACVLNHHNIPMIERNIEKVLETIELDRLEDCSAGNDYINEEVGSMKEDGEFDEDEDEED